MLFRSDHMGRMDPKLGASDPAFAVIRRLIDKGKTWVKLAGAYLNTAEGPPLYADATRLALAFSRDLKRAGIAARVRVADAVQYDRRRITYDYDMIEYRWDQSLSPGNEQAFYWGSEAADAQGTRKDRKSTRLNSSH